MEDKIKKFFVSKSDEKKLAFVKEQIKANDIGNVFVICEGNRKALFADIGATVLPFKRLNETANWINFVNGINDKTLLVVDNIVKFIFFGDGKKKYLTHISQSINNIIVMDTVPFFEEVGHIFYPFYFLGKDILGYSNYQSFKANHYEETEDGREMEAHSFGVLQKKIEGYYVQDYKRFFNNRHEVWWEMDETEKADYEAEKERVTQKEDNPIKIFNSLSEKINLIPSKFKKLDELTSDGKEYNVILNAGGRFPGMIRKHLSNPNVNFHSFHDNDLSKFADMDNIVFLETPIVKPYKLFYIDAVIDPNANIYMFRLDNKLESYFYNRVYDHELRNEFDKHFGQ